MPEKRTEEGRSIPWDADPDVISKRHPLKKLILRIPLWRYISKHVPLPFVVSEFFFGAWMSCVAINLITMGEPGPDTVLYAISAAYMVNIIWGLIDGWTFSLGVTMAGSENDRMISRLRNNRNDHKAKQSLIGSLDEGPAAYLSGEDKEKVVDMIIGSSVTIDTKKVYRFRRGDYHVAVSFLIIDAFMATLTVLPFILFSEIGTALLFSRVVTVSTFACVAYVYAKYLNRNWIFWVAVMSVLGIIIAQATWIYS